VGNTLGNTHAQETNAKQKVVVEWSSKPTDEKIEIGEKSTVEKGV